MPENPSGQEKTEAPSARRRGEARKKGQVAKSAELNTALILLAGTTFFFLIGSKMLRDLGVLMTGFIQNQLYIELNQNNVYAMYVHFTLKAAQLLGPFLVLVSFIGVAVNLLQVGFLWSTEAVTPKLEKLNIIQGLRRLFSPRSVVELLKGLAKLAIIGLVVFFTLEDKIDTFLLMMQESIGNVFQFLAATTGEVVLKVGTAMLILAAADYAYQRWEYERNLKMTKEEVKEEQKITEGNPQIKSRIREMQRSAARRRMMASVPEADVVITNPVHLAVALKYTPEEHKAPVIIAKGERKIAERIKEIARAHRIPIVEDPPLAQLLFRNGEIGEEIPLEAYQAVAEVLSYVYKLQNRTLYS